MLLNKSIYDDSVTYTPQFETNESEKEFDLIGLEQDIIALDINSFKNIRRTTSNEGDTYIVISFSEELSSSQETQLLNILDTHDIIQKYKDQKKKELSKIAIEKRRLVINDYQQINALGGIYDDPDALNKPENLNKQTCLLTIESFRRLYYNNCTLIDQATDENAVNQILENISWPTSIVTE